MDVILQRQAILTLHRRLEGRRVLQQLGRRRFDRGELAVAERARNASVS